MLNKYIYSGLLWCDTKKCSVLHRRWRYGDWIQREHLGNYKLYMRFMHINSPVIYITYDFLGSSFGRSFSRTWSVYREGHWKYRKGIESHFIHCASWFDERREVLYPKESFCKEREASSHKYNGRCASIWSFKWSAMPWGFWRSSCASTHEQKE